MGNEEVCSLASYHALEHPIPSSPNIIFFLIKQIGGEKQMVQQTFDTTDYGDMTLAQLGPDGVEFLLKSIEKLPSAFGKGEFVKLIGTMKGEAYEIRAGGRAAKLCIEEEKSLVGHVISIVPSGDGMQRKYKVKVVS